MVKKNEFAKINKLKEFEVNALKVGYDLNAEAGILRDMDSSQVAMIGYIGEGLYERPRDSQNTFNIPKEPNIPFTEVASFKIEYLKEFLSLAESTGADYVTLSVKKDAPLKLSFVPTFFQEYDEDKKPFTSYRLPSGKITKIVMYLAPKVEF